MLQRADLEKILKSAQNENVPEAQYKLAMHYKTEATAYPYRSEDPQIIKFLTLAAQQKHVEAAKELLLLLLAKHSERYYSYDDQDAIYQAFGYCLDAKITILEIWIQNLKAIIAKGGTRSGKAAGNLVLARIYKEQGNIALCIKVLEEALIIRVPGVVNMLGDIYYNGDGVPKNVAKAFQIFQQSCSDYNPVANSYTFYSYAWMLHRGEGTGKPNIDEAIKYYKKALPEQKGSNYQLGRIYYDKYLEKRDKKEIDYRYDEYKREAIRYLSDAHQQVQSEAFNFIGIIHHYDGKFQDAENYFLRSGIAAAKFNLAEMYSNGKFGAEKQKSCAALYQDAANAGFVNAQFKMYEFYATGTQGYPKDDIKAFVWLQKAAQQKYGEALKILVDPTKVFAHINAVYTYIKQNFDFKDEVDLGKELQEFLLLEKKLQYEFKDLSLAYRALDRNIDQTTKEAKYQLLEFIGDRILNATISLLIYPKLQIGSSTGRFNEVYQRLVENKTILPMVAKYLNIEELLDLDETEAEHEITPKMLADAVEALIGAISLDSKSQDTAAKVIHVLWEPHIKDAMCPQPPSFTAIAAAQSQPIVVAQVALLGHRRKLSATSIELQQKLTGYSTEELTVVVQEKRERATIVTRQRDTLLHLLARQTEQLTENREKLGACIEKMNTLIQFGATLDSKNKADKSARELLSFCPQIKLQGNIVQQKF